MQKFKYDSKILNSPLDGFSDCRGGICSHLQPVVDQLRHLSFLFQNHLKEQLQTTSHTALRKNIHLTNFKSTSKNRLGRKVFQSC